MRIDLILVTRPLLERAVSCEIDTEPRGWEKPSDHAPVVAVFR
jgi:exodeoxyribonuclease III